MQDIRKPRQREQLLEQIRERITPFPANAEDLVHRVIRTHAPEARYTLLIHRIPEQGEDIYHFLVDAFIMTFEIPHGDDLSAADITVEKEDTAEYCQKNGHHDQWLWAAVGEMRFLKARETAAEKHIYFNGNIETNYD